MPTVTAGCVTGFEARFLSSDLLLCKSLATTFPSKSGAKHQFKDFMMTRENLHLMTVSANLWSQFSYPFISPSKFPCLTFLLGGINQACLYPFSRPTQLWPTVPFSPSLHKAVLFLNSSIFIQGISLSDFTSNDIGSQGIFSLNVSFDSFFSSSSTRSSTLLLFWFLFACYWTDSYLQSS